MGRRVCGHVGRPPGRSCAPGRRPHRRTARPHVGRPACAGRWLAPVRLVKAEAAPTRLKGELAIGRFGAGWHDWRVDGDGTAADHFRLVAGDDVSVRVDRHRLQLDVPCTPQRWTGFAVAAADPAREGSTDAPQRPLHRVGEACRRDPWLEQDTPIVIDDTCQFDERRLARRREQFIDLAVAEAHRVGDSHEILPSARSRHPAGEPVDDGRLGHTGQTADQTWRVAGGRLMWARSTSPNGTRTSCQTAGVIRNWGQTCALTDSYNCRADPRA